MVSSRLTAAALASSSPIRLRDGGGRAEFREKELYVEQGMFVRTFQTCLFTSSTR
jgi:hypothetical protein